MYKFLLCWRYLRTRYIALVSIISVMLGVATMIVVNSVMAGFSHEMQNRLQGILADVVFESASLSGLPDAEAHMAEIRRIGGDEVVGITPTVHVPAMLNFRVQGQWVTRQVNFIGIDERTHTEASDFAQYLQHPANRRHLSFQLREGGYDTAGDGVRPERPQLSQAGWPHRRRRALYERLVREQQQRQQAKEEQSVRRPPNPAGDSTRLQGAGELRMADNPAATDSAAGDEELVNPFDRLSKSLADAESPQPSSNDQQSGEAAVADPFAKRDEAEPEDEFDPAREQHAGIVLGIALAAYRDQQGRDQFLILPGDDVRVTFPTAGTPPQAVSDLFTVVDFYESKMSEYDASFVFVPLRKMQQLRGMIDPVSGVANFTSLQIQLKEGADLEAFRDRLRAHFSPDFYRIYTWRDKQGPLLAAVQMETAILNVLLFLIITVAGFGILAIFFMIVVEKTRDIGILKALGASRRGVMGIFLGYGLSLGMVGSGVGLVMGLLFVANINEIADLLGRLTGQPLFDPTVYYFHKIPTIIHPPTVSWIVAGAVLIAVLASILPARRASRLHPVEALRYE